RRRHTRSKRDWSSDVCSSDLLFSKEIATIYGIGFTVVLFLLFTISERVNARKSKEKKAGLEEFNLDMRAEVGSNTVHARPGSVRSEERRVGKEVRPWSGT